MLQPPFRTVKALRRREGIAILCSLLEAACAPLSGQLNTPLDSWRKEKEREGRLQGKRRKKEKDGGGREGRNKTGRNEIHIFFVKQLSIDVFSMGQGLHYKMPHFYRSLIKPLKEQFLLLLVYTLIPL